MLTTMRTTINLPDSLVEAAKLRAAAEGRTFTSLVSEGLRAVLQQQPTRGKPKPFPSFGDRDDRMLVDLLDRQAVWDALDADGPR